MSSKQNEFHDHLFMMESILDKYSTSGDDALLLGALASYASAIAAACHIDQVPSRLSALLQAAAENPKGRRDAAIITTRALAVDGLIPLDEDNALSRFAVSLIEAGFPDGAKYLKLAEKRQTYEKIDAIRGLHSSICHGLSVLAEMPCTLAEIDGIKSEIQRAIRKEIVGSYFQPFGWSPLKSKVIHICDQIGELVACQDSTFKALFDQLQQACDELEKLSASEVFFNRELVKPFLAAVSTAMRTLKSSSSALFACNIDSRRKQPHIAEKRYPLHHIGKVVTITVPMINTGPGVAVNVVANIELKCTGVVALDAEEICLGDMPPGEFAISFKATVLQATEGVAMAMRLSWSQVFGDSQCVTFDVHLEAQDATVDWQRLEQMDPFSLEVAESTQFVGRGGKVKSIGNRLLKAQMSSTYITGQKRVGKTSLAKAVLRYVTEEAPSGTTYETSYLEWGEYSTADARSTVMALGQMLYFFLQSNLPSNVVVPEPNFDGSLAPLNVIAKALELKCPEKRFIIVLDEFDEIHPEMYRYGPLAEVFFANLRTLAARRNLAFILVGGEKMPFIIGAQGDQLNKFVREPLDSFSRSDDWTDFVELVTGPVKDNLNFEDSALNTIFTLTNGHPYYTKLLCAKVFSNAVAQRDTEIISRDIDRALSGKISELDTNSFAHFWKDGINAEREAAEVIELKRLRVLVAFGRASRHGSTTKESISAQISSVVLQPQEIGPLIDDFCRRDIMRENAGKVVIQLPIFHSWLQEVGVSKLISSTLADDLEIELKKANDKAYVTSMEIEKLIKTWPLYRGTQITGESVRAWLDQVDQPQEQRLLFTLLDNLRFMTIPQINEGLRYAHERVVARLIPPLIRESKTDRRRDLLVTYIDGPGKSGATYARSYAKENGLLMDCVVDPAKALRRLSGDYDKPSAAVIVDDLAGTGKTIVDLLAPFLKDMAPHLTAKGVPLVIILLLATEEAELKINNWLKNWSDIRAHLYVHELVGDEERAFPKEGFGFWEDEQARDRAKALCVRLGSGLYKDALGYGSQSLLIAFPDTCPNNNLPIIFASKSGKEHWDALLPRPAS